MTDNMVHYNFPSHTKGDTFNGILFTITVNAVALDYQNGFKINP
jgi:hypothetical protein